MPVTLVSSRWSSGSLIFHEKGDYGTIADILTIATGAVTVGSATQDTDFKVFLGSAGEYVEFNVGESDINVVAVGFDFSGSHADHILDFSSATFSAEKQAIRAGAYGSPIALQPSGGLIYMYGSQSGDTGVSAITFFYGVTTGEGGMIGESTLVESDAGSLGPRTLQGGQFIAGLKSGAYLRTLGGDATAGMYGVWAKVHAAADSIASAGSRLAAIWLDNQMQGTVSGEEYSAFITTGGSTPKAVFGFETTGGGWAQFLHFDETCSSTVPVVTSGLNVSGAGSDEAYLKVLLNATQYGIPLITV